MSSRSVTSSLFRPTDGLAATPTGTFGGAMEINPVQATAAKLQRAKERLYVLCQAVGWGIFLIAQFVLQSAFGGYKSPESTPTDPWSDAAIIVMIALSGLLVSHYGRTLMGRWGWTQLGWRALVPRVLVMAAVLAILWNGPGYFYIYGIVDLPWPSKISMPLIFAIACLNSFILFIVWLSVYFFYHVFERLNRLQVQQLQLAANVKEAELRALKSQVNPHFLFNSLNSLRALIDEDAPRAREAVTRLSNMLRYSLQSGQQETVSFDDELRIVEDYLALEGIRHEDRLRVRWEIAPEARLVNVPPMLLQTLVENAVKYGISTRREGGELFIRARIEGATLALSVTNPGDLNAPASYSAARAGSSTGVGLRNASERLQLLFGDRARLTLRAEPVGHVTADVTIPLNSPVAP